MTGPSWRAGKTTAQRGYGGRWQRVREAFLRHHPLCARCDAQGRIVAATVVDHRVPHRGDPGLMWDHGNLQALCTACHSGAKQSLERSGKVNKPRIGLDGFPIEDPGTGGGASEQEGDSS